MSRSFVFVGDTRPGAELVDSLVTAGFVPAPDIESSEIVVVYCNDQQELENIYFDSNGVISRATEGTCIVCLSATTPGLAKEISAMAMVSNLHSIEAPLVVQDIGAFRAYAPSNLSLLVAGDADEIAMVSDVLDALAATVRVVGTAGSAQLVRCMATITQTSTMVAAAEACAIARKCEPAEHRGLFDAAASSFPQEAARLMRAAMEFDHKGSYTIASICGELQAALDTADEASLVLPQLESVEYLVRMLGIIDGADLSAPAISLLYLEEAAAAEHGLDWTRAEQLYAEMEEHGHAHHHDGEDYDGDDYDFEDFGYGYSPN